MTLTFKFEQQESRQTSMPNT